MNELKVEDLIKEAVSHLLEAELIEENGWTKEHIELLRQVRDNDFAVVFK